MDCTPSEFWTVYATAAFMIASGLCFLWAARCRVVHRQDEAIQALVMETVLYRPNLSSGELVKTAFTVFPDVSVDRVFLIIANLRQASRLHSRWDDAGVQRWSLTASEMMLRNP